MKKEIEKLKKSENLKKNNRKGKQKRNNIGVC